VDASPPGCRSCASFANSGKHFDQSRCTTDAIADLRLPNALLRLRLDWQGSELTSSRLGLLGTSLNVAWPCLGPAGLRLNNADHHLALARQPLTLVAQRLQLVALRLLLLAPRLLLLAPRPQLVVHSLPFTRSTGATAWRCLSLARRRLASPRLWLANAATSIAVAWKSLGPHFHCLTVVSQRRNPAGPCLSAVELRLEAARHRQNPVPPSLPMT